MKKPPYNPSWLDRLVNWIDALPGPVWLTFLILTVLFVVLSILGFGQVMEFSLAESLVGAIYAVYFLFVHFLLLRLATSTFDQFKAALNEPAAKAEDLRYRFTVTPAWVGWVAILFSVLLTAGDFLVSQAELVLGPGVPWFLIVYQVVFLLFVNATFIHFATNSLRKLNLISQLHQRVRRIDLFDLDPLLAFSRYSAATAVALLAFALLNSSEFLRSGNPLADLVTAVIIALLGAVIFVVPLLGLRHRLTRERDQRIVLVMKDVERVGEKLSQAVRRNQVNTLSRLKYGMDGLIAQRDELLKVQTWPWKPTTFRGFSSAFLLPIILWIVTRLLERLI